jgi:hypothetical protein
MLAAAALVLIGFASAFLFRKFQRMQSDLTSAELVLAQQKRRNAADAFALTSLKHSNEILTADNVGLNARLKAAQDGMRQQLILVAGLEQRLEPYMATSVASRPEQFDHVLSQARTQLVDSALILLLANIQKAVAKLAGEEDTVSITAVLKHFARGSTRSRLCPSKCCSRLVTV